MPLPTPTMNAQALQGWRARAWAWVLFVALFKGLVPHVALASVVMNGDPALVWCAPGAKSSSEVKTAGAMTAAAHDCVCAASADGVPPVEHHGARLLDANLHASSVPSPQAAGSTARLLPPARGPPSL